LEQQGYKPIINNPYPDDGKHYKQGYEETETEIRIIWLDNEAEYWANVDYDTAVSLEFRKKYSQDRAEATINNYLLDPINEKYAREMQEMQEYRAWCKAYVKEKKGV
jgi:hypothetical protein